MKHKKGDANVCYEKKAGILALLLTEIEIPVSAAEAEETPDSNVYKTIDGGTQAMWSSERHMFPLGRKWRM